MHGRETHAIARLYTLLENRHFSKRNSSTQPGSSRGMKQSQSDDFCKTDIILPTGVSDTHQIFLRDGFSGKEGSDYPME